MSVTREPRGYRYGPLDETNHEIRIIVLHPGEFDDEIVCDVKHVSLDNNPHYEALSYTWGELTDKVPIELGGSHVSVTQNLFLALQHLRQRDCARSLWVDAICINQSDNTERNDQVKQMAKIYERAKQVHVWLGVANKWSRMAMVYLKEINSRILRSGNNRNRLDQIEKEITEVYYQTECRYIWDAISRLWQRAYWGRIWIIQEVVFGTSKPFQCTVHCGHDSIAWETLVALDGAMSSIDRNLIDNGTLVDNEHSDADIIQQSKGTRLDLSWFIVTHGDRTRNKELPLSYLLIRQSRYKATDPRDKVYALLSMVHDSQSDGLIVDYNLPTAEVYMMALKEMVLREKRLGVLCACCRECHNQLPTAQLPSWCPDWNIDPMDKCCPARLWSYTKAVYYASGDLDADAYFHLSEFRKPILSARGWFLDTISTLAVNYTANGLPSTDCLLFLARGIAGQYPLDLQQISRSAHEAIWKTLVANRGASHNKAPASFGEEYESLLPKPNGTSPSASSWGTTARAGVFGDKMKTCLRKRLLCKSIDKALPGLVPEMAQDGDRLCILVGCALPIVLRKIADHYVVIGESLIHGFMSGEILEMERRGEVMREMFNIY